MFCAILKTLDDLEVYMYNRKDNDSIYTKFKYHYCVSIQLKK